MTEHTHKNEYIRAKEAAAILGISVRSVWNWASDKRKQEQGFPSPIPISERVTVFPKHEIVAFAEGRKLRPAHAA